MFSVTALTLFERIHLLRLLNVWLLRLVLAHNRLEPTWKRIWRVSKKVNHISFLNKFIYSILATVEQLIEHALQALRDTLPAEDRLTRKVKNFKSEF